jgi:hypothetical protein
MSGGSDPGQIREMLATAQGYTVFGREGRRIGAFIELAGPGGNQIAIRHDGVVFWRRRLLPITTVAEVLCDQRVIVLTVDRRALGNTEAAPIAVSTSRVPEEYPHSSGGWKNRIERYVAPADQPTLEPGRRDRRGAEEHLLFVSTSRGYALVEKEGAPPPVGRDIEMSEQGSFLVAKLGPSPLPNDSRICAFLEQTR